MDIGNWKPWLMLSLLLLVATSLGVAQFSYVPLVPFIESYLNLTPVQIGSLASVTFLGGALAILLAGWLVDLFNVKLVSLLASTVTLVGLIGMAITSSYGVTVFLFFLIGFGFGAISPVSVKGVMIWVPVQFRAFSLGVLQSNFPLGAALAAATLPLIAINSSYQRSFVYLAVIMALIMVIFALLYHDSLRDEQNGVEVASHGEEVREDFRYLVAEILKFCPIPLSFSMVNMAWTTFLVSYLYHDLGVAVLSASSFLAFSQVAGAIGRPLLGFGSDKLFNGNRKIIICLLAFIGGASLLALVLVASSFRVSFLIIPVVMLMGFATMGWNGPYYAMIAEMAGIRNAGLGTSIAMTFSFLGAVLGPPIFGLIVDKYSYQLAFLVSAIWIICLGIFYSFVKIKH